MQKQRAKGTRVLTHRIGMYKEEPTIHFEVLSEHSDIVEAHEAWAEAIKIHGREVSLQTKERLA
jgi:hypothetical protein